MDIALGKVNGRFRELIYKGNQFHFNLHYKPGTIKHALRLQWTQFDYHVKMTLRYLDVDGSDVSANTVKFVLMAMTRLERLSIRSCRSITYDGLFNLFTSLEGKLRLKTLWMSGLNKVDNALTIKHVYRAVQAKIKAGKDLRVDVDDCKCGGVTYKTPCVHCTKLMTYCSLCTLQHCDECRDDKWCKGCRKRVKLCGQVVKYADRVVCSVCRVLRAASRLYPCPCCHQSVCTSCDAVPITCDACKDVKPCPRCRTTCPGCDHVSCPGCVQASPNCDQCGCGLCTVCDGVRACVRTECRQWMPSVDHADRCRACWKTCSSCMRDMCVKAEQRPMMCAVCHEGFADACGSCGFTCSKCFLWNCETDKPSDNTSECIACHGTTPLFKRDVSTPTGPPAKRVEIAVSSDEEDTHCSKEGCGNQGHDMCIKCSRMFCNSCVANRCLVCNALLVIEIE
jgi:hypothetical protein